MRLLILTAKSSSRSGDRSSGIITCVRKDGVFSFLSSLLIVFNWPDKSAKLSKTDGLSDKNIGLHEKDKALHQNTVCGYNLGHSLNVK